MDVPKSNLFPIPTQKNNKISLSSLYPSIREILKILFYLILYTNKSYNERDQSVVQ